MELTAAAYGDSMLHPQSIYENQRSYCGDVQQLLNAFQPMVTMPLARPPMMRSDADAASVASNDAEPVVRHPAACW